MEVQIHLVINKIDLVLPILMVAFYKITKMGIKLKIQTSYRKINKEKMIMIPIMNLMKVK